MLLWTFLEGKEAASLITLKMCELAIKLARLQKTATSPSGRHNMQTGGLDLSQVCVVSYLMFFLAYPPSWFVTNGHLITKRRKGVIQSRDHAYQHEKSRLIWWNMLFRRRIAAPVADRLTETQATVHKCQAWFHGGMSRDKANKILQAHATTDGYVIFYSCRGSPFLFY